MASVYATSAMSKRVARWAKVKGSTIEEFGVFIDTHRDQPHIGSFHADIHRGSCRPTSVDYDIATNELINRETSARLTLHPKHMFVTTEWFTEFIIDKALNGSGDPRDADGIMPTSHLRDARSKVYLLKSFRQIFMSHYMKAP